MWVVGLLSSKQEVDELKYIANICDLEDRIRFIVRMQKIKEMLKNDRCGPKE